MQIPSTTTKIITFWDSLDERRLSLPSLASTTVPIFWVEPKLLASAHPINGAQRVLYRTGESEWGIKKAID